MASAQQFALEYVQNGRGSLEAHLRNPSMVADKLRRNRIISEKAVRKVKSYMKRSGRTRALLNAVIARGEVASNELLKTLYETRHQALPNTQSNLYPDLHQWISCFSFTEDPDIQSNPTYELRPCESYRRKLKLKAKDIVQMKWERSLSFLKDKTMWKTFTYIPLVLNTERSNLYKIKNKAYKKSREKKLKTYIPSNKENLTPDHLLNNNEKKILLVGKPGIGKTTVVEQVLSIWSENERYQDGYMFYFDEATMRSMSHSSQPSEIRSLLFDRYVNPEQGKEDEVLWDILENSENVTVVFDGLIEEITNPVLREILNKNLLCDAKVLITCRPEAEECEFLMDWPSYRVEVKGFNDESIHAYFKWMLGGANGDKECGVLNNLAVFSLCHVPMYAFIVTACISYSPCESDHHPCTITEMYVRIFRHCMKIHADQNVEHLDKYIQDRKGEIRFLSVCSYQAMLNKSVNLTGLDCKDNVQQAFLTFSSTKGASTSLSSSLSSSFLHNTMQEFWAALFLLMTPNNIRCTLQKCKTEEGKYLKYIVSFFCGLVSSRLTELIRCVVPAEQIREISSLYIEEVIDTFLFPCALETAPENLLFVCQCLYEHQSPEACLLLLQKVDFELNLCGEQLDPQQCCAVSYVINQSTLSIVRLFLNDCSVSDRGLKLILDSLDNIKLLSLDPITQCQMWKVALHPGNQTNFDSLLRLCESELHLSTANGQVEREVFQEAGEVLRQRGPEEVELYLHFRRDSPHLAESLVKGISEGLPNIKTISFVEPDHWEQSLEARSKMVRSFQLDLLLHGALHQQETGQRCVENLLRTLPMTNSDSSQDQSSSALFLYLHVKTYEKHRSATVLPTLLPVFHSTPAVWHISLGDSKIATLLEVLKLTEVKKPLELRWSDDETELRSLFPILPFVSQLRFNTDDTQTAVRGLLALFRLAKQQQILIGEPTLSMLSDVCSYPTFPFGCENTEDQQTEILLDLYSSAMESQLEPKDEILSALQSVLLSAPAVWVLDMSEEKGLVLLKVLELTEQKISVRLKGWHSALTAENTKRFIAFLPHLSQLWVSPRDDEIEDKTSLTSEQESCVMHLCVYSALDDMETGQKSLEALLLSLCSAYSSKHSACKFWQHLYSELICEEQVVLLLCELLFHSGEPNMQLPVSVLHALKFTVKLTGWLPRASCDRVGSLLGRSPAGGKLNVTLTPQSISLDGAQQLFKQVKEIHKLRTNEMTTLKLARLAKSKSFCNRVVIQELTLVFSCPNQTQWGHGRVLSSIVSLLSSWKVNVLDLKDCPIEVHHLTALLCHEGSLTIRLSPESLQQLALMVFEAQDKELTHCFLEKVNRDLSECTLDWEVLQYLLVTTTEPISANLKKIKVTQRDIPHLLPVLRNVRFQRMNGHFTRTALRAIHQQRAGHLMNSFLTSSDKWINFSNLTLDYEDCEALRFAVDYSVEVKLNLLWTVIPVEKMENILQFFILHRVSELRVDRSLLLNLLHTLARFKPMQYEVSAFLAVLHHKLDLSCSSSMDMTLNEEVLPFCICSGDCRILSLVVRNANADIELNIKDCVVEDAGLEELFPVLHRVHLRLGKSTLLQLLHLIAGGDEDRLVRHATSLWNALGKEVDLSHTSLDLSACSALAQVLEYSEGLSKLDLNHCGLGDEHLDRLLPHLHKTEELNLCNNQISHLDEKLKKMDLTQNIRLLPENPGCTQPTTSSDSNEHHLKMFQPDSVKMESSTVYAKTIEELYPSVTDNVSYSYCFTSRGQFRCRDTGLVFWMRGEGTVSYRADHWDEGVLANSEYEPGGTLFNIQSPGGQMYRLDLPHCEADVYAAENLMVVHISEDRREFLVPKRVSQSHVSVGIDGLSRFAVVRKLFFARRRVQGQVLFFLEPKVTDSQHRLWVFLLPRSIPLSKVEESNKEYKYIKTSSYCIFRPKAKYSVNSDLNHSFQVQPKKYNFVLDYNPRQHATFEVFLSCTTPELEVRILEKAKQRMLRRWCRRLILKAFSGAENNISSTRKGPSQQQWLITLCKIIEDLSSKDLVKLKSLMHNTKNRDHIPKSSLEEASSPSALADLMVNTWGVKESIFATREFMKILPRNDEVMTSLLGPFVLAAEGGGAS